MGGCASKPKGMDLHPTEVSATRTNKPHPETISQGNNNNGGESAAAPLVDLSDSNYEPKQEAAKPEPGPEPAGAPESTAAAAAEAEKVEGIAKESEDKAETTVGHSTPTKEGHPKTLKTNTTTPTSEDKNVAPVVAVV